MPTCPQCGQENPEGFKFCGSCGAALAEAPAPREVRKTVTVVFSDVTGSTALGERLDPESLRRVMSRYFDEMQAVVERHGGTVEKFIGDAVMAVFGIPVLHEDDAVRAVRAAAEMRVRLAGLNEELERDFGVTIAVRTGVNTGEVVAGDASSGGQRFATGDAVNVAKRLEEAAPANEILLGETTHRLVRDAVEVAPVEPLELKGKGEPVRAHRLLSIEPGAEGRARRLDSPMVGREREQALLERAYERAAGERGCHLFTVLGAAGVGKSRLLAEFLKGVGERATVVGGRCLPYGEGITFWPLLEVLRKLYGEELVSAIETRLAGDQNAGLIASRVGAAVGLAESAGATEETFWAVRKLLEAQAHEQPLVLVFDDLQWGQPTFLDLVEHVADWSRDAPILLICLARPEFLDDRPGWGGGKFNATSVLLEPLSDENSAELVHNLLGRAGLADDVRARITDAAEGNPLFVEEMLAMLIDDGLLERSNGDWVPSGDFESVAVPPTIQALLAARLERLGANERSVIERASVEGKVFHRGGVVELSPTEARGDVGGHLQTLVRKELVRPDTAELPGEDAFRFRHLLIRDAAYDGMPKELRAELHERFAAWLERATKSRRVEYQEILGYHLEQAYGYRAELAPVDDAVRELGKRAAGHLESAGRRALVRGDGPATTILLRRAQALLPPGDPRLPGLLVDLGAALIEQGKLDDAERRFAEAAEAAQVLGNRGLELRAKLEGASVRILVDPKAIDAFRELTETTIPELESLGDEQTLAVAWRMVAHGYLLDLRGADMEQALRRSIEHARRAGDRRGELEGLVWLLRLHWFGPAPVNAGIRLCEQTLAEADAEPRVASIATQVLGVLYGLRGDFEHGRELLARAGAMQDELGMELAKAAGNAMMSAGLEQLAQDYDAAEAMLRPAIEVLRSAGEKGYYSTLLGYLAHVSYAQGKYDEADELAREADEAGGADDIETQRLSLTARGKVLARRGERAEAERLVRAAAELLAPTDGLVGQAEVMLDLAEVLALAGRRAEASAAAREAARLYAAKGADGGVRLAEARVAELEA
ncbi:MAG TPA: adenylate/guanylate cyclase domain-containing protein [Gaiellaceae bacterium]|nr:adenylate/guanylate cyclase domain-containing protein [Gaiellaceae bacterium]